jgi:dTDP-6-deoxy-L-talose 4-dehydrogenase (NAD+)
MKVAVTGATGFIGRHLLTALQNADVEIVALVYKPCALGDAVRTVVMDITQASDDVYTQLGMPDVLDLLPNTPKIK